MGRRPGFFSLLVALGTEYTYIFIYSCIYLPIYIYTHAHKHTYIYIYIYTHIHLYKYMYTARSLPQTCRIAPIRGKGYASGLRTQDSKAQGLGLRLSPISFMGGPMMFPCGINSLSPQDLGFTVLGLEFRPSLWQYANHGEYLNIALIPKGSIDFYTKPYSPP